MVNTIQEAERVKQEANNLVNSLREANNNHSREIQQLREQEKTHNRRAKKSLVDNDDTVYDAAREKASAKKLKMQQRGLETKISENEKTIGAVTRQLRTLDRQLRRAYKANEKLELSTKSVRSHL